MSKKLSGAQGRQLKANLEAEQSKAKILSDNEEKRKERQRIRKQMERARKTGASGAQMLVSSEACDALDPDAPLIAAAVARGSDAAGQSLTDLAAAAGTRGFDGESDNESSGSDTSRPVAKAAKRAQVWISQSHSGAMHGHARPYTFSRFKPVCVFAVFTRHVEKILPQCGATQEGWIMVADLTTKEVRCIAGVPSTWRGVTAEECVMYVIRKLLTPLCHVLHWRRRGTCTLKRSRPWTTMPSALKTCAVRCLSGKLLLLLNFLIRTLPHRHQLLCLERSAGLIPTS